MDSVVYIKNTDEHVIPVRNEYAANKMLAIGNDILLSPQLNAKANPNWTMINTNRDVELPKNRFNANSDDTIHSADNAVIDNAKDIQIYTFLNKVENVTLDNAWLCGE